MKEATGIEDADTLTDHIAQRVRSLRAQRDLSLGDLAAICGVSRSMLSLIERGESSPTAVVLERLATGLQVPLASLFDRPTAPAQPVSRAADQLAWRDPDSGYVRRNVSPAGVGSPIQVVDVDFPAGARVAYDTAAHAPRVHQQVWVLDGRIDVRVGANRHSLQRGDCLAFVLDQPVSFHNPGQRPARYAVIVVTEPAGRAIHWTS